jgi:hypothetical protein
MMTGKSSDDRRAARQPCRCFSKSQDVCSPTNSSITTSDGRGARDGFRGIGVGPVLILQDGGDGGCRLVSGARGNRPLTYTLKDDARAPFLHFLQMPAYHS